MPDVKPNEVYQETLKVVELFAKKEMDVRNSMFRKDKLEFLKKHKITAKSREEILQLEEEEKEIKFSLQLDDIFSPFTLPAEMLDKVKNNFRVEDEAAQSALNENYSELSKLAEDFYKKVDPLLKEIETRVYMKVSAQRINHLLDGRVHRFPEAHEGWGQPTLNTPYYPSVTSGIAGLRKNTFELVQKMNRKIK
ncbi:hypothetical protein H7T43_09155 [Peribacillus simplex]|uniref:hypothetical protein n=1 Tax=Peribacillus simplex TaxID=1478 RepID=UPI002989E5A6|nr:hypothetical protein [Peribacillus simplex]MBX9955084.1 hypothetical protein [Peribacillus simplex]